MAARRRPESARTTAVRMVVGAIGIALTTLSGAVALAVGQMDAGPSALPLAILGVVAGIVVFILAMSLGRRRGDP